MCWIQVLCDECPFYNFQIPHRLLVYRVSVREVTEEIKVDATMTNPQSLYSLINLLWIDSSGINIWDWNLRYVIWMFCLFLNLEQCAPWHYGQVSRSVFQKVLSVSSSGYWYPPSPAVVLSVTAVAGSSFLHLLLLPGSQMPRRFSPSHILCLTPEVILLLVIGVVGFLSIVSSWHCSCPRHHFKTNSNLCT